MERRPTVPHLYVLSLQEMHTDSDARENIEPAHADHAPCLFAHIRALPAVDLEPLALTPMRNEMPF